MAYNKSDDGSGPQGTQAFSASEVNQLIVAEIINAQSTNASIPALIGLSPGIIGQKFMFDGDKVTIGRSKDNDIRLTEASVSSMHAQIRNRDGRWKLMNLLSSNGTYVNGVEEREIFINQGDQIAFAKAEFVFCLVDPDETKPNPSNKFKTKIIASVSFLLIVIFLMYYFSNLSF